MPTANSHLRCGDRRWLAAGAAIGALVLAGAAPRPEGPVRGVIRAIEQASISTDLSVRVAAIHVREGDAFDAGDKLVEFDCRRQIATVAAADAQQQEMQLTVDKNRMLLRTNSVGKNDLDVSETRLAKARAEADALRSQLAQCVVVAPFRGRVSDLTLHVHETSQPGKPFIGLVAHERLEIDLIVPSDWVRRVGTGKTFDFRVDEMQRTVKATVVRTSPIVDPVSQTIKLIAAFDNVSGTILPGMSGTAEFASVGE